MSFNTIKEEVETRLAEVIKERYPENPTFPQIEPEKNPAYGDLSSNIAFSLAKILNKSPQALATTIAEAIPNGIIEKAEALRGFVNIWVSQERLCLLLPEIEEKKDNFGRSNFG